jgi:hypothetical protein
MGLHVSSVLAPKFLEVFQLWDTLYGPHSPGNNLLHFFSKIHTTTFTNGKDSTEQHGWAHSIFHLNILYASKTPPDTMPQRMMKANALLAHLPGFQIKEVMLTLHISASPSAVMHLSPNQISCWLYDPEHAGSRVHFWSVFHVLFNLLLCCSSIRPPLDNQIQNVLLHKP